MKFELAIALVALLFADSTVSQETTGFEVFGEGATDGEVEYSAATM